MIRSLVAASLLAVSQIQAAEPVVPTLWEITLTRTDQGNKILSQAKAPVAVYPAGDFKSRLAIDMGSPGNARLWTVECRWGGEGIKVLKFMVLDTTRTGSWNSDGIIRAIAMFDGVTTWHGAGRYLLFTMAGESLTADFHPAAGAKDDKANEAESAVIVVTRRDRSRKILSQTTVPWVAAATEDEQFPQLLAIQYGTKENPQTRLVQCIMGNSDSAVLEFRVEILLPLAEDLSGTQMKRVDLIRASAPINDAGKYLIHALDGETLEAEIRAAGGGKGPVSAGEK